MLRNSLIIFLIFALPLSGALLFFDGEIDNTWNTAANWSGDAIPADGDTVVIGVGYNVTLDSDQVDVELNSLTILGTLTLAGTASCKLDVAGVIDGGGQLLCGSSETPLPATRYAYIDLSDTDSTINSSSLDLQLYCWQPSRLHTTLDGAWSSGTSFTVNDDVSDWDTLRDEGMTLYIRVDEAKGGKTGSTEYEVSGISGDGLTITVTAFVDAKSDGDTVVLITRNIQIKQTNGGATDDLISEAKDGSVIGAELRPEAGENGITNVDNVVFSGTISGCSSGWNYSTGTNSGTISGCSSGWYISTGTNSGTISGCASGWYISTGTNSGTISGCDYGWRYSSGTNSGTISGCDYGWYISSGTHSGTISGCDYGWYISHGTGYGGTFSDNSVDNSGYNDFSPLESSMLYDFGGVAGDFKAYCHGGVVVDAAGAEGYDVTYTHTKDSTDNLCFRQITTIIPAKSKLTIRGIIKVAGDHSSYIPRLEIIDIADDPITGGSALSTDNLPVYNGTNTEWQEVSTSYNNTTDYDKHVYIRVSSSTADENINETFNYIISGAAGGGSSWLGR